MTLLIGSVHNVLTILVTAIYSLVKLIKSSLNLGKVTQNPLTNQKFEIKSKNKTINIK